MSAGEILHRLVQGCSLAAMRLRHAAARHPSRAGARGFEGFGFCAAAARQLPDLPWEFDADEPEIQSIVDGKGPALGHDWRWRDDAAVWHEAPDTNRTWPRVFFGSIPFRAGNPYGDVRVVWEPARLQHLISLALVGRRSSGALGRRSVDLLERQLLSFLDANPPMTGVHYISAMECALRILAACYALDLVRDRLQQPERTWPALVHMVDSHAWLIERRLSLHSSTGNHTIAECAGLIYAGVLFPELKRAARWKALGRSILRREAQHQILRDGGGIEQAFWYHLFVVDLVGLVLALLKHRDEPDLSDLEGATERGMRFLNWLASGSDQLPHVGDRDGGFALSGYLRLSWTNSQLPVGAMNFDIAGCSVIRARGAVPITLLFDHGPLGLPPSCGHGHADALAVSLVVDRKPLLLDTGTYTYTGDPVWRAYFRGTRAHNTVVVDGLDQAKQESPFQWSRLYQCECRDFLKLADGGVRVLARHNGYGHIGVMHWRAVVYRPPGSVLIWDYLTGRGVHEFELNWHCSIEPAERDGRIELATAAQQFSLDIAGGEVRVLRAALEPLCGWASSAYGSREPIATVQARYSGTLPHEFVTRMETGDEADRAQSVDYDLAEMRKLVRDCQAD